MTDTSETRKGAPARTPNRIGNDQHNDNNRHLIDLQTEHLVRCYGVSYVAASFFAELVYSGGVSR